MRLDWRECELNGECECELRANAVIRIDENEKKFHANTALMEKLKWKLDISNNEKRRTTYPSVKPIEVEAEVKKIEKSKQSV